MATETNTLCGWSDTDRAYIEGAREVALKMRRLPRCDHENTRTYERCELPSGYVGSHFASDVEGGGSEWKS